MSDSSLLDPRIIKLDMENPRFSLIDFKTEKEVIEYLIQYEDVKNLAIQIIKNGYISLGERIIVLESLHHGEKQYTVLEGNRRVAALKIIFNEMERFSSADRKRIAKLNIADFFVDCDIVSAKDEDEARFKITAKHIDGIKVWNPTDKRVFYDNLFTQYRDAGLSSEDAINTIETVTPETKTKIKNALRGHRFLSLIHTEVKIKHPNLGYLSHLDTDVLLSRVQQRLKKSLLLIENSDFFLECKPGKESEFKAILLALGEATWINKTLTTRTFSTQNMWENILIEDTVIPGLARLIQDYNLKADPQKNPINESKKDLESQNPKEVNPTTTSKKTPLTDSNKSTPTDDESNDVKYKIFISKQTLDITDFNYDLTDNIKILDSQSNTISKNSSIFKNVHLYSADSNIAIKNNRILPLSENGKYTIHVTFFDIEKSYSIFLKIPYEKPAPVESHDLFSDRWLNDSVSLLSSKEEYSNIVSVLKCLNNNKNIMKSSDNLINISFLIRILIEYSSKAYWDKFRPNKPNPKSLPTYVSQIASHLFNKNIINKEEKKSFSNGNDLEILNGQIHDYRANISLISIETIFKAYKIYLDKLFLELNK